AIQDGKRSTGKMDEETAAAADAMAAPAGEVEGTVAEAAPAAEAAAAPAAPAAAEAAEAAEAAPAAGDSAPTA
ncbi:MAG: hypothetical protein ACJAZF_004806, partial [Granulosicoccus sp.]